MKKQYELLGMTLPQAVEAVAACADETASLYAQVAQYTNTPRTEYFLRWKDSPPEAKAAATERVKSILSGASADEIWASWTMQYGSDASTQQCALFCSTVTLLAEELDMPRRPRSEP